MQILSVELKNIKSHRDTKLEFSPGINVLVGANGIGKSTIFEAIGYALFGVDAQSFVGNVDRFVSIGAKRGEIKLVFRPADGNDYRVCRTVGGAGKWLLEKQVGGDFEVEEHKDGKETESRLKKLLNLDNGRSLAEQFELVIGPFQHDFLGPFVIKQATKRRDKFDEILGIDAWRKTFNETKHLGKAIEGKLRELQAALQPLTQQLDVLPQKQAELVAVTDQQKQVEGVVIQQEQELARLQQDLQRYESQQHRLQQLRTDIATLQQRLQNGVEKIALQKQRVDDAQQAEQIVRANEGGKHEFEKAEARLQSLRQQQQQQRQLELDIAEREKQQAAAESRYRAEQQTIEETEKELQQQDLQLAEEKQKLGVDPVIAKLAGELPQQRRLLDDLRRQLGQLDGRRAGLSEGQEKLADGICPFFQEECKNLGDVPTTDLFAGKLADLDQHTATLQEELSRATAKEAQMVAAEQQQKTEQIKLQGIEQQLRQLGARRKANQQRRNQLEVSRQQQKEQEQQLSEKHRQLSAFTSLQEDIAAAEEQKQLNQQARDLFLANQQAAVEMEARQQELRKYQSLLTQLQGEQQELQHQLQQLQQEYQPEQHQQLKQQNDNLRETLGTGRQKLKELAAAIIRLQGELEKLQQVQVEIASKQAQVAQYQEKEQLLKFLRNKVFRNVSAQLSERFRSEISQRAERIYRTISEQEEELCWGENYQIVLRDMVDGDLRERVDDQLSGGQTMSAVVALRLALLQTIGARVAFFDEPTSNLDAERRENLAHAFRAIDVGREEVTEHWYDQLFLISHDVAFTEVTDQIVDLATD